MSAVQLAAAITERGRYTAPRSTKPLDAATVSARVSNPVYRSRFVRRQGLISLADPEALGVGAGPHRSRWVWSNFDRLPGDEVVAFARSAEAAGYDSFWTQETAGRDPFALLGHLAGRTERIGLAVGIAVVYGRDSGGDARRRGDRARAVRRSDAAGPGQQPPRHGERGARPRVPRSADR